jgi:DNA-binding response OmpR family regulator
VPLKVLLVESESKDAHSVKTDLQDRGYEVTTAHSPFQAPSVALSDWPDVIILNNSDGALDLGEICRALDATQLEFPRLIVSSPEIQDHHGAPDACLPFPFTPRQLTQHVKKVVSGQDGRFLRIAGITLDGWKRCVQRAGRTARLTPKEYKLLRLLMQHAGEVLNRRTIMKEVWETDYLGDTRTLDVHIRWVREKLEDDPGQPQYIFTIRGVGYRFRKDP